MGRLTLIFTVLYTSVVQPKQPTATSNHICFQAVNKVCQDIVKLSPHIKLDDAYRYSNAFVRVARRYKIPVQLLVSIAKQESNFRLGVVRTVKGLIQTEDGDWVAGQVGSDFCMMQINAANITHFKMDASKLTTEPEVCIEAGARILASARKFENKEPAWWTRYNAVSDIHREIYQQHILKHWRKIDPAVDALMCQAKVATL